MEMNQPGLSEQISFREQLQSAKPNPAWAETQQVVDETNLVLKSKTKPKKNKVMQKRKEVEDIDSDLA